MIRNYATLAVLMCLCTEVGRPLLILFCIPIEWLLSTSNRGGTYSSLVLLLSIHSHIKSMALRASGMKAVKTGQTWHMYFHTPRSTLTPASLALLHRSIFWSYTHSCSETMRQIGGSPFNDLLTGDSSKRTVSSPRVAK